MSGYHYHMDVWFVATEYTDLPSSVIREARVIKRYCSKFSQPLVEHLAHVTEVGVVCIPQTYVRTYVCMHVVEKYIQMVHLVHTACEYVPCGMLNVR